MQPADRTAWSVGPSPVGTELECPPLVPAVGIDCMLRWIENQRARLEHVRQSARIIIQIWHDLGEGDIAGRIDEFAELAVCNWNAIDPERVDRHAMNWRLVRIVPVRSHTERTAGNPDHVSAAGELCCRVWRLLRCNSVKLHRRYVQLAIRPNHHRAGQEPSAITTRQGEKPSRSRTAPPSEMPLRLCVVQARLANARSRPMIWLLRTRVTPCDDN